MAARRRSAGTRRGISGKRLPAWAWLIVGLLVGVGIAWAAHLYVTRSAKKPKPAPVVSQQPQAATKKPEAKQLPPPAAKPRFDFYTILPEMETVLPDKEPRASKPKPAAETDVRYVLQAGAFANFEDADRLKARLALAGLEARIEKISIEGRGDYYRVRLGPYLKLDQLEMQNKKLIDLGVQALRIKVKKVPG